MTDLRDAYTKYLWAPFTQMGDIDEEVEPLVIVSGEGARVTDSLGREYIDGHGALWLANVGFGRQEIVEAATEQLRRLSYFPSFAGMANDMALVLAERLVNMTEREGMSRVFFSSGGSEAVETALKMARQYWRLKGQDRKYKVIARKKAYHGVTMGALSATGLVGNRRLFEPLVPGFRHIEPPHCYHCPYGLKPEGCNLVCAAELERTIEFEGPDTVAAFIGEPVMGAGGVIIPPDGYWQEIERICRKHDVLLIADEVITGFGRTGEMFGVRQWGVRPDIMVTAKALTSGYLPLGATLTREEIFHVCLGKHGEGREFRHGNTYSGHPAACAAAMANIDIIEREDLVSRSRENGKYLLTRLQELESLPAVGNVDGLGLIARLELARADGTPFPPADLVGLGVARNLMRRGIILRALGDVVSFSPPLVIDRSEIDAMVDALGEVVADL
ncbi:MAG: aspartate aminotransferase family protein [Bacillota bacterium]